MENRLNTAVFCFLGLFFSLQALPSGPEDVQKYWKCFNYADCLSDRTEGQKITTCINILKPENLKRAVNYWYITHLDRETGGGQPS
ncbi:hypothetical protein AVEN_231425-1 [Araneus ventricosus]|uniref:Uncharacterized protein n=1 Tax=Araneus ventricosus TaxID=182803 RepID=A0A4Y2S3U5_ARAVE|nr:hypothetical protein AVEN_141452-1 [Araneus ventricosus]GBN87536.1 hypothetical protein AVEN_230544-1 [Araneus ventricosus]GBN87542.1 hypothetical protein AVEN_231425-1 [Araneus ventricosus]